MKVTIEPPLGLNEIGGRSNNEDSIFPRKGTATTSERLFLVCDGVGGSNKGEEASRLVSKNLDHYFRNTPPIPVADQQYLDKALAWVEGSVLSSYAQEHPECRGMSTTLTLLHFGPAGATLAWVGDSRIYQVRNGQIIYVTKDHSLVNELVKQGQITEAEAETHPQKNVIMRAISGKENPTEIERHQITDIQAGDYFFLCSDGILESYNDRQLATLLASGKSIPVIIAEIDENCRQRSRDNYSCYLVQIESVSEGEAGTQASYTGHSNQTTSAITTPSPASPLSRILPLVGAGIGGLIVGMLLMLLFRGNSPLPPAGYISQEAFAEKLAEIATARLQQKLAEVGADKEEQKAAWEAEKQEIEKYKPLFEGGVNISLERGKKVKIEVNVGKTSPPTPEEKQGSDDADPEKEAASKLDGKTVEGKELEAETGAVDPTENKKQDPSEESDPTETAPQPEEDGKGSGNTSEPDSKEV